MLVYVHHHRKIGTPVSHIDDVIVADAESGADLLKYGDLAPAGGGANDPRHFSGRFVVAKPRAENPLCGNNPFQRRLNDLLRRGGDNVEVNLITFSKIFERASKQGD